MQIGFKFRMENELTGSTSLVCKISNLVVIHDQDQDIFRVNKTQITKQEALHLEIIFS